MRLFIAIQLNDEMKDALVETQAYLRKRRVGGNYTKPENLHLTMAFIGEYNDPDSVLEVMQSVPFKPFSIRLEGFGCFGDLYWCGLAGEDALTAYVRRLRHALAAAGIPYDRKRFSPHITLIRRAVFSQMPAVEIPDLAMEVQSISLMRSDRGNNGMIYTELGSVGAEYDPIDMNLRKFDGQCVRILTAWGEVFEGVASFDDREYAFHEYGHDEEALRLTPIIFYKSDISSVISLEDVNGPFGHYSERYGLLEMKCLEWGTDMIEEVFDSEDDSQILRMLACIKDHFQSLADRAVPGMAPWRSRMSVSKSEDDESEQGPVYLGELEKMLRTLVKYKENEEVVHEAKGLLERLSVYFS